VLIVVHHGLVSLGHTHSDIISTLIFVYLLTAAIFFQIGFIAHLIISTVCRQFVINA
jgi:hypothetical protein